MTAPALTAGTVTDVTSVTGVPTPLAAADGKSFVMNLASIPTPSDANTLAVGDITKVLIYIPKHAFEVADPRANLDAGVRTVDGKSAEASITINYVRDEPANEAGDPMVFLFGEPVIRCYLLRLLRRTSSSCSVNSRKRSRRIMWMSQTRHGSILSL